MPASKLKPGVNEKLISRFVEMRLVVKQCNALLRLYAITQDYSYLDEASKLLGEFDESTKLPPIPYGQLDKDDINRQQRDGRLRRKEVEPQEHICEHLLPLDLCQKC